MIVAAIGFIVCVFILVRANPPPPPLGGCGCCVPAAGCQPIIQAVPPEWHRRDCKARESAAFHALPVVGLQVAVLKLPGCLHSHYHLPVSKLGTPARGISCV